MKNRGEEMAEPVDSEDAAYPFDVLREHPFDAKMNQLAEALGFDGYGGKFENDVFKMAPYSWAVCACEGEHAEECPDIEPHFWHKPSGYKLRWYKYIFRGAQANMDIDAQRYIEIIDECLGSLR